MIFGKKTLTELSTAMSSSEKPEMASDKIDALIRALEYLKQESDDESLSYMEIYDIDIMYIQIQGRGYDK